MRQVGVGVDCHHPKSVLEPLDGEEETRGKVTMVVFNCVAVGTRVEVVVLVVNRLGVLVRGWKMKK